MSLCDPYRELELYLEEAKDEITRAFENETFLTNSQDEVIKNENSIDFELDPFLLQFNATIKSDLLELLSRYPENDDSLGSSVESLLSLGCSNGHINVATQTTPSLSPNSTNLSWASSSPCLTSLSDDEEEEEDCQSLSSSSEGKMVINWSCKSSNQQILLNGVKSSSAPVLKKVVANMKVNKQSRSQSDRHLAEIEAAEACKWLRAAGFPQYAQMYEDMQFPVDVAQVAQDHPLLDQDVLNSLYRRIQILNSCAHLHQQRLNPNHHHNHHTTDESEDECCALSDNWTYQKDIRRWSRTCRSQISENNRNGEQAQQQRQQHSKEEVFEQQCSENPREKLRRAGSTKFRRRREGMIIPDTGGSRLLDSLTQQLSELSSSEFNHHHISDSECTPRHTRRSRTKSVDTTDSWFNPQLANERILWRDISQGKKLSPEKPVDFDNGGQPIYSLSCTQLQVLRKLALLKLTTHMEKYCPSHRTGWNWDLPKFIRKIKAPVYKDKLVFGVPLTVTLQRTGQSIPRNIEEALLWLQQNAADQVGIFRKPGVKSRIQTLRNLVETTKEILNYNDQQSYDVADMVKQYFRELPETLLTNKLSETFLLIFQYVPPYLRRESVLCAILLMPDEHVEVLQSLLYFLLQISKHSTTNQMNENNLALCFAPSLFHYSQISFKQNLGAPQPRELAETSAGHECLLYLLKNNNTLFKIPKEFINQCKISEFKDTKAVKLSELGKNMGGWREYLNECQTALLKEVKERGRGWVVVNGHNPRVEISYKKVADGHPLRLWKVATEVEATPSEILHRILRERHIWDPDLHSAKIVSQIEKNCEVFQYVRRKIIPLPNEEFCVIRTWRGDLPRDACLIIETSIEHQDAVSIPNTVRGVVLASRYLIEPCGSGRCKVLHLSRVDSMGRTPEWYQKNYGHVCAMLAANVVSSFAHGNVGSENKM